MKKNLEKTIQTLEELVKNLETLTDDSLNEIVHCPEVDVTTLTEREKFSCLVYDELRKALATKNHQLLLDCNYPKSNMHHKSPKQLEKGQEPQWLVDYYRLVTNDEKSKSLVQIYVRANPKTGTCKFNLYTSCAADNLAQFIAMKDELFFEPYGKKNGEGAKTTRRMEVDYADIVDICKAVAAILATTSKAAEEKKKAKEKPKKEEPKDTIEE